MGLSLEQSIGFHFRNPDLLRAALTHKSFSAERSHALGTAGREQGERPLSRSHADKPAWGKDARPYPAGAERKASHCNERLEFLGDSVLSAVVAHRLYENYPGEDEGSLSKRKAALVARPALARWAKEINLGAYLLLSSAEDRSGGRLRPSILCNALEALIGAIYLDGGYGAASQFIERWLAGGREEEQADYKSRLQEILQKRFKVPPQYEVARTAGPDHDKTFTVTVKMAKQILGNGSGKSKKEAEQSAAKNALDHWKGGS